MLAKGYGEAFLRRAEDYLRAKWLKVSPTLAGRKFPIIPSGLTDRLQQGLYRSVFRGTGLEFLEVREYSYGDDPRNIDWNVSARFGKLFVRTFLEEKEIPLFFLFDLHLGMLLGKSEMKLERGLNSALFLASLALKISEKMGLWVFVARRNLPIYLPPLKGPRQVHRIFKAIIDSVKFAGDSALIEGLRSFMKLTRRKSFVFIFSDFLRVLYSGRREELISALKAIRVRHDLFCFITLDDLDIDLPNVGIVELQDPITGVVISLDTSDPTVRENYRNRAQETIRNFIRDLEAIGVDWVISFKDEDIWRNTLRMLERRRYRILRR